MVNVFDFSFPFLVLLFSVVSILFSDYIGEAFGLYEQLECEGLAGFLGICEQGWIMERLHTTLMNRVPRRG